MDKFEELSLLKAENESMKARLERIDNNKKKSFIAVICICIVGIIASAFLVFSFSGDVGKYNNDIKDAGSDKTKIVFSEKTFYPVNKEMNFFLSDTSESNEDYADKKYAKYYDSSSKTHKVCVLCNNYDDEKVILKVKNKKYVYVSKELKDLNVSLKKFELVRLVPESKFTNKHEYAYYGRSLDYTEVETFERFYADPGEGADKKITENFLGNKARSVRVYSYDLKRLAPDSTDGTNIVIGEFFQDDKGDAYFYDYISEKAYPAGKELKQIVYEKN